MRLIDADAFDTILENGEIEAKKQRKYVLASAINTVRGNLAKQSSVSSFNPLESSNGWIPCSIKKHPDSKIECYVTIKDYTDDYGEEYDLIVDADTYYPEHDAWDYYCDLDVIAWMPKNEPKEPYQER